MFRCACRASYLVSFSVISQFILHWVVLSKPRGLRNDPCRLNVVHGQGSGVPTNLQRCDLFTTDLPAPKTFRRFVRIQNRRASHCPCPEPSDLFKVTLLIFFSLLFSLGLCADRPITVQHGRDDPRTPALTVVAVPASKRGIVHVGANSLTKRFRSMKHSLASRSGGIKLLRAVECRA